MIKNFTLIALSYMLIVFSLSCKKDETSSVNPGGTSVYSFEASPGTATPATAGIYAVNRPMDPTNTLTFNVNVTVKGTYSIRTTSSNGVYFETGGTFATTGLQQVIFYGKGTPLKVGNFPYVPVTNNTCNFTVTYLGGVPAAVFTYSGAPATCTAPVINGAYAAGVGMGSANYVDLAVNVTTPGAYTVSTNSADGISFSGSGAFSATGAQVIRLIGNGTPSAAGSFVFTPSGGCNFSIIVAPPPPPASFTYTCAPATVSGTFAAGTALTSSSTVAVEVNVATAGLYSVTTTSSSSNGVTFSASGIFSGTGIKTITLTSNNTPTAGGTFSYTPSGAGCSFDVTYTSGPPPPADYLKCTIDGVAKDFTSNLGGILQPGLFSVDGDLGTTGFTVSVIDNNGDPITVGTYNKATLSNLTRYASASYLPDVSNPFGAWQPFPINSNPFTVTIATITTSPNIVTGTFSGDLFDNSGGNKKIVTNGSFSISY